MPTLQELLDRERRQGNPSPAPSLIGSFIDSALQGRKIMEGATRPTITPPSLPGGGFLPPPGPPAPLTLTPDLMLNLFGRMQQAAQTVRPYQQAGQQAEQLAGLGQVLTGRAEAAAEAVQPAQQFPALYEAARRTPLAQQTLEHEQLLASGGSFEEYQRILESPNILEMIDVPRSAVRDYALKPLVPFLPGNVTREALEAMGVPPKLAGPLVGLIGGGPLGAAVGGLSNDQEAELYSWFVDPLNVLFFPAKSIQAARATLRASAVLRTRVLARLGESKMAQAMGQAVRAEAGFARIPGEAGEAAAKLPQGVPSELAGQTLQRGEVPLVKQRGPKIEETFWGAEGPIRRSRKELVADLAKRIKGAKEYAQKQVGISHEEMQKRAKLLGTQREAAREAATGVRGLRGAARKLAGEHPISEFEPPFQYFTPNELNELSQMIIEADLRSVTYGATSVAFLKAVFGGQKLTMSEIVRLEKVFGPKLANALMDRRGLAEKTLYQILDVFNLPRALLASFDFSYPMRQAVVPTVAHPKEALKAFKGMMRSLSEKQARQIRSALEHHPAVDTWEKSGLDWNVPWEGGLRTERESEFASKLVDLIPLVRISQRVFVTYGNLLRTYTFETSRLNWEAIGRTFEKAPQDYRALARWMNISSGRGEVKWIKEFLPALNSTFFSPRLVISRVQMPLELFTTTPAARSLVARDLAIFTMTGLTALAAFKQSGLAEVELNPLSSDWGKARIGKTRLDFWGGLQPIARYTAQLLTGKGKFKARPGVPEIVDIDRKTTIGRFLWSKLAPGPGLIVDIAQGKTFIGQDIDLQPKNIQDQIFNRLVPLFVQDLVDATREEGLRGFILAMPGILGVGVQTYEKANERQIAFLDSLRGVLTGDELDALERGIVPNSVRVMPEWREIQEELEKERRDRPGSREYQENLDVRNGRLQDASDQWEAGTITGVEARKTAADARNEFRIQNDVRDFPGGGFLDEYYKATYDEATDELGQLDYEKLDELIMDWEKTATPEEMAAISEHELAADTEMERLMREDRVYIRDTGYWDLPESLWKYAQDTGIPIDEKGTLQKPPAGVGSLDDFLSGWVERQAKVLVNEEVPQDKAVVVAWGQVRNLPFVKALAKGLATRRAFFRERDDRLRQALLRWYKPISQEEMAGYGFPVK